MTLISSFSKVTGFILEFYCNTILVCRPGHCSQYNGFVRAGRSRDQVPVEAIYSAPVQTGPGSHLASCTMGTGSLSRG